MLKRVIEIIIVALLVFTISMHLVYNAKVSQKGFWESFEMALKRVPGIVLKLTINSVVLSLLSLISSAALGYALADLNVPKAFKYIMAFPEIFIVVILDLLFSLMGFRIRGLSTFWKFTLIFSLVVLRRFFVFHDYFRASMMEYKESIAYKLIVSRRVRRRQTYILKNTVMDSLSSLSFEIPLILTYISMMERVVVYPGVSNNFLKSLQIEVTPYMPMAYAFSVTLSFIGIQIIVRLAMLLRDRRSSFV